LSLSQSSHHIQFIKLIFRRADTLTAMQKWIDSRIENATDQNVIESIKGKFEVQGRGMSGSKSYAEAAYKDHVIAIEKGLAEIKYINTQLQSKKANTSDNHENLRWLGVRDPLAWPLKVRMPAIDFVGSKNLGRDTQRYNYGALLEIERADNVRIPMLAELPEVLSLRTELAALINAYWEPLTFSYVEKGPAHSKKTITFTEEPQYFFPDNLRAGSIKTEMTRIKKATAESAEHDAAREGAKNARWQPHAEKKGAGKRKKQPAATTTTTAAPSTFPGSTPAAPAPPTQTPAASESLSNPPASSAPAKRTTRSSVKYLPDEGEVTLDKLPLISSILSSYSRCSALFMTPGKSEDGIAPGIHEALCQLALVRPYISYFHSFIHLFLTRKLVPT